MVYPFLLKKKYYFISLPFNIFYIIINYPSQSYEVSKTLKTFYLNEVEPIIGLDSKGIFSEHLAFMR